MIDLICTKCRTKLPVAENKIGTRIFMCPKCAAPLEPPGAAPAPVGNVSSEDATVAPDASHDYAQEKLRQIAEKRAKAKESPEPPRQAPPLGRPVVKKSAAPIVLLPVGGVAVAGVAAGGILLRSFAQPIGRQMAFVGDAPSNRELVR